MSGGCQFNHLGDCRMKPVFLFLSTLAVSGCSTPTQMMLDAEVKRLCAIDGGMKVYEKVTLPASRFNQFGAIQIPDKANAKPTDDYYYEWSVKYYREGSPTLRRDHFIIIRRSDEKVLGEDVSYARRGGDIKGPWHDSSYRCPDMEKHLSLESAVFVKEEK